MSVNQVLKDARGLFKRGEYVQGEKLLRDCIAEGTDSDAVASHYMFWCLFGAMKSKMGHSIGAIECYEKAKHIDAMHVAAWQGLRDVYLQQNDGKKALNSLQYIHQLAPTDDLKRGSALKAAELACKLDTKRIVSEVLRHETEKKLPFSLKTSSVLALAVPETVSRHAAESLVHRTEGYGQTKFGDTALLHCLLERDGSEPSFFSEQQPNAPEVDWALRRALNCVEQASEDSVAEQWLDALTRFTHDTLKRCNAEKQPPSYWTLYTAALVLDNGEEIRAELVHACHNLAREEPEAGDTDGADEKPKLSLRKNKTAEEIIHEQRLTAASLVLATGRIAAITGVANANKTELDRYGSTLYNVYSGCFRDQLLHLPPEARNDLRVAVASLTRGVADNTIELHGHCALAVTLFRLNDLDLAAQTAEHALAAVEYRVTTRTLLKSRAHRWATRLTAVRTLAHAMLGRKKKAVAAVRACVKWFEDALGSDKVEKAIVRSVLANEVCLATPSDDCKAVMDEAMRDGLRDDIELDEAMPLSNVPLPAALAMLHTQAKLQLVVGRHENSLRTSEKLLSRCGEVSKGVPGLAWYYTTRAEVLHILLRREESFKCATNAIELDDAVARAHCLVGHYYHAKHKRPDTDGSLYTKADFQHCYSSTKQWVLSGFRQRRIDPADGCAYTQAEFEKEYGSACPEWEAAVAEGLEHDENAEKARESYWKCLQLNPLDTDAGVSLCTLLSVYQRHRELHQACSHITTAAEAASTSGQSIVLRHLWAFRLQGFHSLRHGRYQDAARCLQTCHRFRDCAPTTAAGSTGYALARAYEGQRLFSMAVAEYRVLQADKIECESDENARLRTVASKHGEAACLLKMAEDGCQEQAVHPTMTPSLQETLSRVRQNTEASAALAADLVKTDVDFEPAWSLLANARLLLARLKYASPCSQAVPTDVSPSDNVSSKGDFSAPLPVSVSRLCFQAVRAADEAVRSGRRHINCLRQKGDVALACAHLVSRDETSSFFSEAVAAFEEVRTTLDLNMPRIKSPSKKASRTAAAAHARYDLARAHFSRYSSNPEGQEADRSTAEKLCREAVKLLPQQPLFWNLLACASGEDLPNKRLWCVNRALQLDPSCFAAWCNLGWILLLYGQPDTARMAFDKAAALEPKAWQPWLGRGLSLLRTSYGNMTHEAKCSIEKAYTQSQAPAPALMSLMAHCFYQPRQYGDLPPDTDIRAREVQAAFSDDAGALNVCGLVLEEAGDYGGALTAYRTAESCVDPECARPEVVEWVSGKNALLPALASETLQWADADAYTKLRMLLTSQLRVLCRMGEGSSVEAEIVREKIFQLVSTEDLSFFESTSRAVLCSLLVSRKWVRAEELLSSLLHDSNLAENDVVTHDALLAGLSVLRCRESETLATAGADNRKPVLLPRYPVESIRDEGVQRVAALLEQAAISIRDPSPDNMPDLTLARSVREKLFLFNVLLHAAEPPTSVRYHDPADHALVEFRYDIAAGSVRYLVDGEPREPFKTAVLGEDEEGAFLQMPDIDRTVTLPVKGTNTYKSVFCRLIRMFGVAGVKHNLTEDGGHSSSTDVQAKAHPSAETLSEHATGQLLSVVRSTLNNPKCLMNKHAVDTVNVLYAFAGFASAMPERIPDTATQFSDLIIRSVAVLRRVGTGSVQNEVTLFKARYALALLLYTAPHLFLGAESTWEDVLQPEPPAASNDITIELPNEAAAREGQEGSAKDEEQPDPPALVWCEDLVTEISQQGYIEASTLLGLALYAQNRYIDAVEVLRKTLQLGYNAGLGWRRWDAHQGVIASLVMLGRFDDAVDAVQTAGKQGVEPLHTETALTFVDQRKRLAQGTLSVDALLEDVCQNKPYGNVLGSNSNQAQNIMDLIVVGVSTQHFDKLQSLLLQALPKGSLLKRNIQASLCAVRAWNKLKKTPEGLPAMQADHATKTAASAAKDLLQDATQLWKPSIIARELTVLVGILLGDPDTSSSALNDLRRDVPRVDHRPFLYYWLSSVKDSVTPWQRLTTLLQEVANSAMTHEQHQWFAVRKVLEHVVENWPTLAPAVRKPDASKLKSKEFLEAIAQQDTAASLRKQQVAQLTRIGSACLQKLYSQRPGTPYIDQKKAEFDKRVAAAV